MHNKLLSCRFMTTFYSQESFMPSLYMCTVWFKNGNISAKKKKNQGMPQSLEFLKNKYVAIYENLQ